MTKDEILVVRCNVGLSAEELNKTRRTIKAQIEDGVVVLPWFMDALIVPADLEIRIEAEDYGPGEDASPRKAGGVVLT